MMNMEPRIESIKTKKLIGMSAKMSVANNKTVSLWARFMPRRLEIKNVLNPNLFSLQQYDEDYFKKFDPHRSFVKWATVEVSRTDDIPSDMHLFELPKGKYAVFHYKGIPGNPEIFHYIYGQWLPKSGYVLDNRPHFEVLGPNYKRDSADSEEEIWIPVRERN